MPLAGGFGEHQVQEKLPSDFLSMVNLAEKHGVLFDSFDVKGQRVRTGCDDQLVVCDSEAVRGMRRLPVAGNGLTVHLQTAETVSTSRGSCRRIWCRGVVELVASCLSVSMPVQEAR